LVLPPSPLALDFWRSSLETPLVCFLFPPRIPPPETVLSPLQILFLAFFSVLCYLCSKFRPFSLARTPLRSWSFVVQLNFWELRFVTMFTFPFLTLFPFFHPLLKIASLLLFFSRPRSHSYPIGDPPLWSVLSPDLLVWFLATTRRSIFHPPRHHSFRFVPFSTPFPSSVLLFCPLFLSPLFPPTTPQIVKAKSQFLTDLSPFDVFVFLPLFSLDSSFPPSPPFLD